MHKTRLYILQGLGIIMLIFGYLLSDRPDSESVMHFNLSGNHVISCATQNGNDVQYSETTVSEHKAHHHKLRVIKQITSKIMLPSQSIVFHYKQMLSINYIVPLSESYYYLYCKEINPPPPKFC